MKRALTVIGCILIAQFGWAQGGQIDQLLYGVAYYDEYMPYDRLEKDIAMMKEANISVVSIAESTWGTVEPQDGVYNFYHIDRVLDTMQKAGIKVIVGTPTYAVPTWLVKKYPDMLATTQRGEEHVRPQAEHGYCQ